MAGQGLWLLCHGEDDFLSEVQGGNFLPENGKIVCLYERRMVRSHDLLLTNEDILSDISRTGGPQFVDNVKTLTNKYKYP